MKFSRVRIDGFYNLKDVDLDLTNGNALIVGPNGSGKTNIIKCINLLVKEILQETDADVKMQGEKKPECYIEVNATLSKAELEIFSKLKISYLVYEVCVVVALIVKALQNLFRRYMNYQYFKSSNVEKFYHKISLVCENHMLGDLPKETLCAILERSATWHDPMTSRYRLELGGLTSSLMEKTIRKLFPELLKITKKALASDKARPKSGADIVMWMRTGAAEGGLGHSSTIVDDVWFPAVEEEKEVIWTTVKEFFGELKAFEFSIKEVDSQNKLEKSLSLEDVISKLVAGKCLKKLQFGCSEKPTEAPRKFQVQPEEGPSRMDGGLFTLMHESAIDFSSWLSNWDEKLGKTNLLFYHNNQWMRRPYFADDLAKYFLKSSICILPQNRGLLAEEDIILLGVNKVERLLIQSSLSLDEQKQKQYASVVAAVKSFCCIDIHVREKKLDYSYCKESEKALRCLTNDLAEEYTEDQGVDFNGVRKRASKICQQMVKQAPSLADGLQVLVTQTLQNGDSPFSITTPLSGLSGGEIETLMALCAIHLSGADTVILDEPGHSLHPPLQAQMRRWIETQRPQDQVCVVVTHSTQFISPQSLSSLYHMSFVGSGFTPFRLCLQGQVSGSSEDSIAKGDQAQSGLAAVNRSMEFVSPQPLHILYHMFFKGNDSLPLTRERVQASGSSDAIPATDEEPGTALVGEGPASGSSEDTSATDEEPGTALVGEGPASGSSEDTPATDEEPGTALVGEGPASGSSEDTSATEDEAQSPLVQEAAGSSSTPQSSQTSPRQVTFTQEVITMLMRPDMRKMFFATGLYFVEGETDKRVLSAVRHCMMEEANDIMKANKNVRHLLRAKEVQEMDRWDILALGGCSEAVKAYKAATELRIPCAIVLDLDAITVKNGKRVGPFNSANWKKSKLYKQLQKEQQSLPEAETLLNDVEVVLKEDIRDEALLMKAQKAFQKHGFWIWKGDLEAVLFDIPAARIKLQAMKSFLEAIEGKLPFSSSPDRKPMPAKEALNNFDEKVMGPLRALMEDFDAELSAARDKVIARPTEPLSENLKEIIENINKTKVVVRDHNKYVNKGTKKANEALTAQEALQHFDNHLKQPITSLQKTISHELSSARERRSQDPKGEVTKSLQDLLDKLKKELKGHDNHCKKGRKKTSSDDDTSNLSSAELSPKQHSNYDTPSRFMGVEASSSTSEASRSSQPVMTEAQQSIFWDYIKRKLHDEGGWGRIPWETLLEVVKVCLQTEPSPLADFCRFMKRRQCKGQKRKKEFPQDLLSRILPPDEEDDDDDD